MTLTSLPEWDELIGLRRPLTSCEKLIVQMVGSIACTTRQEPRIVYEQQRRLARQSKRPEGLLTAAKLNNGL